MPQSDMTRIRLQLLAQGYRIIPNYSKETYLPGWNDQDYVARQLTSGVRGSAADRVERWEARFPRFKATGVRVEGGLVVIDMDIDHVDVIDGLLGYINDVEPDIYNKAPTRYGGGDYKLAMFCRHSDGEPFTRIASRKFLDADGKGHRVEIFGGKPWKSGKCSRQFGIYGPHSYNEDGTVAREYVWGDYAPELKDAPLGDLPGVSTATAWAIVAKFEELAIAAGWTPDEAALSPEGDEAFDITAASRFTTNMGHVGISYDELCELYAVNSELRVRADFIPGDTGTNPTRCQVHHSARHDCVGVHDHETGVNHYPASAEPVDPAEFAQRLRASAVAAGIPIPEHPPNWRERTRGGAPRASLHNAMLALDHSAVRCLEDTFHNRAWMTGAPEFAGEVTDGSLLSLRVWLSNRYGLDFTEPYVRGAVDAACQANRFNPVFDMLKDAEAAWDGVARLDRMAADYFNMADTELNRRCVRKVMIAAVARVRKPGCKFDTILVMESREGLGKSSAWAILAGEENFSDERIIGKDTREVQEHLAGIWIHENADLAGMRKAEVETVKAFASRQVDRARPAYGRKLVRQPRHSIEIGTTNNSVYLQSQTGNRRFWPVEVLRRIDLAKLRADRLLLWGEAAHYQSQDEPLELDEHLWDAAAVEQDFRRVQDAWEDDLARMSIVTTTEVPGLGPIGNGVVHIQDGYERVITSVIFEHVLRIATSQRHEGHARRLSTCMRVLGWEKTRFTFEGKTVRGYERKMV